MGKIVLIEPHKVLQQAISLFLFPQHDVRVEEGVGASGIGAFGEIDLMIVDAAALRETGKLSAELTHAIQSSAIPTVWIDESESGPAPKRDKLAVVMKPIEAAVLEAAVAELLSSSSARKVRSKTVTPGEPKSEKAGAAGSAGTDEPELIDLTEIVEEESSPSGKRKPK